MKTYEFIVTLVQGTEHSDELVSALYEAGCDDGTVWSSAGIVQIGFSREAESLESAIRSSISDIQKVGGGVDKVTMEAEELASLLRAN